MRETHYTLRRASSPSPSGRAADSVVLAAGDFTVVTDELEAASHLADGEEAEALGQQHAAGHELGAGQTTRLLEDLGGGVGRGAGRR